MNLDRTTVIAGLPIKTVRDAVREKSFGDIDICYVMARRKVPPEIGNQAKLFILGSEVDLHTWPNKRSTISKRSAS